MTQEGRWGGQDTQHTPGFQQESLGPQEGWMTQEGRWGGQDTQHTPRAGKSFFSVCLVGDVGTWGETWGELLSPVSCRSWELCLT